MPLARQSLQPSRAGMARAMHLIFQQL